MNTAFNLLKFTNIARTNKMTPEQINQILSTEDLGPIPPGILSRLAQMSENKNREDGNSIFGDSREIMEILKIITKGDKKMDGEKQRNLCKAALFHDLGKTGPQDAMPDEQEDFITFFNLGFNNGDVKKPTSEEYKRVILVEMPLEDALDLKVKQGKLDKHEKQRLLKSILDCLGRQKDLDIKDSKNPSLGELWRQHTKWSVDILKNNLYLENDPENSEKIIKIVGCHHYFDWDNPLEADLSQEAESEQSPNKLAAFIKRYNPFEKEFEKEGDNILFCELCLIIADKYQAYRKRGKKTHNEAMSQISSMVQSLTAPDSKLRKKYDFILNVMAEKGEEIKKVMAKNKKV